MSEQDRSFEQAMDELESIVDSLEREDLDLEEALALFEKGVGYLRDATRKLDAANGRVEELIEEAAGSWELRPVSSAEEGEGVPAAE
jgi:exodeoxyribonuclease VII small subunit